MSEASSITICSSSSHCGNGNGKGITPVSNEVFAVPRYWGSPLEGQEDLGSALEKYLKGMPRVASLSLIREPLLMSFARKSGIAFITEDALEYIRQVMKKIIVAAVEAAAATDETVLTLQLATRVCEKIGLPVLGAETIQYLSESDVLDDLARYQRDSVDAIQLNFWKLFKKEVLATWKCNQELSYSLVVVRRLVDTGRANVKDPTVASTVGFICHKLDGNTFRYMMSFLITRESSTKSSVGRKLMYVDINDNWSANFEERIEDAQSAGVDILTEEDSHTGINYLHRQAIFGHHDDCQKLIEMGMDPDQTSAPSENGDGWGELEHMQFAPLNFAACNGEVECAKVLLRNGANASCRSGWDGGHVLPIYKKNGDYWYTSNNTPLHQAARGNHVGIIHLILDGPDEDSIKYASDKGIDLRQTWVANIEDSSPSEEVYDSCCENCEEICLTPLGMALLFGNFEAAVALLLHGAELPALGAADGVARRVIYTEVFESQKFAAVLESIKTSLGKNGETVVSKFMDSFALQSDASDNDDNDSDTEMYCVKEGDLRVPSVEDPEDYTEYSITEGLLFGEALKQCLIEVHPLTQLSRNAQLVLNDFVGMLINRICTVLKSKNLNFSKGNVNDVMLEMLPTNGEIVKYALSEMEKDYQKEEFVSVVLVHIAKNASGLSCGHTTDEEWKTGVKCCAAVCDYFCCEILEMAGNVTQNFSRKVIGADDISFAITQDVELYDIFKFVSFGLLHMVFGRWDKPDIVRIDQMKSISQDGYRHLDDYYASPGWDWITPASGISPEFDLIKLELKFFQSQQPENGCLILSKGNTPSVPTLKLKELVDACIVGTGHQLETTLEGVGVLKLALENYVLILLRDAHAKHISRFDADNEGGDTDDNSEDDEDGEANKPLNMAACAACSVTVEDCQGAISELAVKFL